MKLLVAAAIAALGCSLSGCATIVKGKVESFSVNTTPEQGAQCTLQNSQGTWYLASPGSVMVHKSGSDLRVTCTKPGYQPGHGVAVAQWNDTTVGNAVLGPAVGAVGVVVDAASGSDYTYDSPLTVPLGAPIAGAVVPPPPPLPKQAQFPIALHCASPAVDGVFLLGGPHGYITANVRFDVNTTGDADAVSVTPTGNGVCMLTALDDAVILSATFAIAQDQSSTAGAAADDIAHHIDVVETPPDTRKLTGRTYTFTVKPKDATPGKFTIEFRVVFKRAEEMQAAQ